MLKTKYPICLKNNKDLQLGPIYLKYLGYDNLPILLTIYELERPAILAYNELKYILAEVSHNVLSGYGIKGLFSLALAHFETMLSDLMKKQLQFFPQKIGTYKQDVGENNKNNKEIVISQSVINRGSIIETIIENEVQKLSYKDVSSLISAFRRIMSLQLDHLTNNLDQIVEIKETRNLLLHNNLYVNEFYLTKTKSVKRSTERGVPIPIDKTYAITSITLILEIVYNIVNELRMTFGKYTLLNMLGGLWGFTFRNKAIRMEDFSNINIKEDIFDGPFNFPSFLSSSEKMYMEFWQAQRTDSPLSSLSLAHLDSGTKLAFLVDVFGELRLTHY
jgi:hypothetical protein